MPVRTAIIEDNSPFAQTFLRHFSRPDSVVQCTAVYSSAEEAIEKLPADPPQVAMVDINLPGMSGIECIARLREICPQVIFLVLTSFGDEELVFEALKAGACGYLLKRTGPDELTAAITDAVAGGAPMSPQIARQVVSYFHPQQAQPLPSVLSEREGEIIELLASGLRYKEISDQLGLSFETIRSYIKRIYGKLHVHSRTEAVTKWLGPPKR
jgi:DNA-binding NarL/FixJ family response regulator